MKYGIKNCIVTGYGYLLDVNDKEKQLLKSPNYIWEDCRGLQQQSPAEGYIFDGASKWFGWRILGYPWGASAKAGLIHDWAFTERFLLSNGQRISFDYAAELYYGFLRATGVNWFQSYSEYVGVLTSIAKEKWESHNDDFGTADLTLLNYA